MYPMGLFTPTSTKASHNTFSGRAKLGISHISHDNSTDNSTGKTIYNFVNHHKKTTLYLILGIVIVIIVVAVVPPTIVLMANKNNKDKVY